MLQLMGDERVNALTSMVKKGKKMCLEADALIIEGMIIRAYRKKNVMRRNEILVVQLDKKADKQIPDHMIHGLLLQSANSASGR